METFFHFIFQSLLLLLLLGGNSMDESSKLTVCPVKLTFNDCCLGESFIERSITIGEQLICLHFNGGRWAQCNYAPNAFVSTSSQTLNEYMSNIWEKQLATFCTWPHKFAWFDCDCTATNVSITSIFGPQSVRTSQFTAMILRKILIRNTVLTRRESPIYT